jgi:hypothetical protein
VTDIYYIVAYTPIARQRVGKHIPAEANARNNRTSVGRQRNCKHASVTIEDGVFRGVRRNNEYNKNLIRKSPPPQTKTRTLTHSNKKTKWITFTYSGKEVRSITKLFQDTRIKIAFRTQNTIQNILTVAEVAYTK